MATNISLTTEEPSWAWDEASTDPDNAYNFQMAADGVSASFIGSPDSTASFDGAHTFSVYVEDTNLEIGQMNGGAGDRPFTVLVGPNSNTSFATLQSQWEKNLTIDFSDAAGTGNVSMNIDQLTNNPSELITVEGAEGGASFTFTSSAGTPVLDSQATTLSDGVLTFYDDNDEVLIQVNAPDLTSDDLANFEYSGSTVTFACFVRGTLIATPDGQKRVEDFQAGDQVLTASGGVRTVKWIGHRTLYGAYIPKQHANRAFPVRITAGALAPEVPVRDLYVSPYHHMYFDGKLVPAMLLVNGKTIIQDFSQKKFEYFHLELDQFDILMAEGAASESYVDTGNRSMFQNVNIVTLLADFGPPAGRQSIGDFELVRKGPKLAEIRDRLLERAEEIARLSNSDPTEQTNEQVSLRKQA